ncbi:MULTISPECIES: hypothetical protein [Pseudomonas]|uniref:hypothetical protein n=1 Tax=Pseudomonas TaxID=286 RepID=UPI001E50833D|nr:MULTISPECIES: hypothetical protein [Pseudomonas]MCE1113781.1 hypothetical protein [Pseudomonas sp. NMI795_08]
MHTAKQAWTRIDLSLPTDQPVEIIARPPYLVGGFFYSSMATITAAGKHQVLVTKHTQDGQIVTAFGAQGTAYITIPEGHGAWFCFVESGDYLTCGVALREIAKFSIFRLNKNTGLLDPGFGNQGFKVIAYPEEPGMVNEEERNDSAAGYAGSVPQFPDGKLRQAVNSGLAQFDLKGNLDTTFNEVGMRRYFVRNGHRLLTMGVAARYNATKHDGFYYHGYYRYLGDDVQGWVGAIDKNGAVISSFGDEGIWIATRLPGHPDTAHINVHSVVQAHGAIYIVGNVADSGFLLRLNLDGTVDQTFNGGNARLFQRAEFDRSVAFAVTPDKQGVLVGVQHTLPFQDEPTAIVRLDASGEIDTTFGSNGWLLTPPMPKCITLLVLDYNDQSTIELRGYGLIARHPH